MQERDNAKARTIKPKIKSLPLIAVGILIILSIISLYIFASRISLPKSNYQVTNKDHATVLHVRSNDTINLNLELNTALIHTLRVDNPAALEETSSLTNSRDDIFTAKLKADQPGIANLYIFGKPKCNPGQLCPNFITQDYKLTIVVAK